MAMVRRRPFQLRHRQADAFDGNRSLEHDILLQLFGDVEEQPEVVGVGDRLQADEAAGAVHVALHHVTAHAAVGLQRQLQVDLRALGDARERSERPGFGGQIGAEGLRRDIERGQADAADGDAVAFLQLFRGVRSVDGDAVIAAAFHDAGDGSNFFN